MKRIEITINDEEQFTNALAEIKSNLDDDNIGYSYNIVEEVQEPQVVVEDPIIEYKEKFILLQREKVDEENIVYHIILEDKQTLTVTAHELLGLKKILTEQIDEIEGL